MKIIIINNTEWSLSKKADNFLFNHNPDFVIINKSGEILKSMEKQNKNIEISFTQM